MVKYFLIALALIVMSGKTHGENTVSEDTVMMRMQTSGSESIMQSLFNNSFVSTPDMAALSRNIVYPINYSTGTPDIKIPLYTIKCGTLTLPLYLSYNASGVKVDDVPGVVGQGWSFVGIPTIARNVNGHIDKDFECTFDKDRINSSNESSIYTYIKGILDNNIWNINDGQPDDYYYRLAEKSGMFTYLYKSDVNGVKYGGSPYDNVRIELDSSNKYFCLTDDDGTFYRFDKDTDKSTMDGLPVTSGWKASAMVNVDKTDSITFTYGNTTAYTILRHNDGYTIVDDFHSNGGNRPGTLTSRLEYEGDELYDYEELAIAPVVYIISDNDKTCCHVESKELIPDNVPLGPLGFKSSVNTESGNPTEINFKGNTITFGYIMQNGTYRMKTMTIKNSIGDIVKVITFDYALYGNNRSFLESVSFHSADNSVVEKYTFEYESPASIVATGSRKMDFWGYYNGAEEESTLVPRMTLHTMVDYRKAGYGYTYRTDSVRIGARNMLSRATDERYMKNGTLKSITYPTGCKDEFVFEANRMELTRIDGIDIEFHLADHLRPIENGSNIYQVGGLRIKEIKTTDNNNITRTRTFCYNDNGAGTSPVVEHCNYFLISEQTRYYNYLWDLYNKLSYSRYRNISATPLLPLTFENGASVMYQEVTEYEGTENDNSGKTVYTYHIPDDTYKYSVVDISTVCDYKYRNWSFGHLKGKSVYKKSGDSYKEILKEIYTYRPGQPLGKITGGEFMLPNVYGYSAISKRFADEIQYAHYYNIYNVDVNTKVLTEVETTVYDDNGKEKVTNVVYNYGITHCTLSTGKTTKVSNDSIIESYKYPLHEQTIEPYKTMVAKNMISPVIALSDNRGNGEIIETGTPYNSQLRQSGIRMKYGSSGNWQDRISFTYNSHGDRIQASKDGKENVVYLYGYNHQYVIAVIENATYNDVETKLGKSLIDAVANAVQPSASQWNSINSLRTSAPSYSVTTYKYKPLVGVTSVTDPSGLETRYTYDGLGRLISKSIVPDGTEMKVENYEYHYAE